MSGGMMKIFASCSLFVCVLLCGTVPAQNSIVLVGSGSTVPAPLYNRWTQEFGKRNSNVQLRYLPVGTSEGIQQISHNAGDFAAGEAQLTDLERKQGSLIELPVVLIAIVPVYNLPGVQQELKLSGEVLASIFLGDIKMWDAPPIAKLNPDVTLPKAAIQVITRPPGKGSNYVFSDFLSKVSSKFRSQIGVTPSPKWPVGSPAERSSDMADKVKNTPGSIGYVEYQYAVKSKISQAAVQNRARKFVKASLPSMIAACQSAEAPNWKNFSASLVDTPGVDSFPITSFPFIYVRLKSADATRRAALNNFLDWMYTEGQQFAVEEGYSELPPQLLEALRRKVKELR